MTTQIDLKQLERRAFRATFQDGLWDMMLGLTFLFLSITPWLDAVVGLKRPFNYLVLFAFLIPCWLVFLLMKKHITTPRLGRVKFSVDRQSRIKQVRIALGFMVLATIGLIILVKTDILMGNATDLGTWSGFIIDSGIFLISFTILAYLLDYPRLYVYAWLFAAAYPLSVWIENQTGLMFPNGFTFAAIVVILIGLFTFVRFLRKYPRESVFSEAL